MREFWLFTAPSSVKCFSLNHKMFHCHSLSTIILAKKLVAKLIRFSGSAGFSCFKDLILYEYHLRKDLKIFRTINHGRDKSRDTTRALEAWYCEPGSLSTTAKATSSTVSFEMRFLPLLHIAPKSPVSSNFSIIFFKACRSTFPQSIQSSIFMQCNW